ncbi:MAG: hypothetical protein FRX49_03889 [Trebouxia sp. A1-2]|nr:MAG: hypothetical protein FRX49_03889 [Trebouxia sp. A1-2]
MALTHKYRSAQTVQQAHRPRQAPEVDKQLFSREGIHNLNSVDNANAGDPLGVVRPQQQGQLDELIPAHPQLTLHILHPGSLQLALGTDAGDPELPDAASQSQQKPNAGVVHQQGPESDACQLLKLDDVDQGGENLGGQRQQEAKVVSEPQSLH